MEKRTKEIKIRLTDQEHEQLLDRCENTYLAEWLRELGLGRCATKRKKTPEVDPALLRQVAGIGNNLNQIARRLNQLTGLTPMQQTRLTVLLTSLDSQLTALLESQRDR